MKFQATVEEVMNTDVKTVDMDDDIKKAAEIMAKHRVGSVLVMGQKHLKGILTAEDIVHKHVAKGLGEKVSDIMTKNPYTITSDKTIEEASEIMARERIKKLPVLKGDTIVGIVTASDIIRVEPALYEILLEQLRIHRPEMLKVKDAVSEMDQCESCGNYSDDLKEVGGIWMCSECRE